MTGCGESANVRGVLMGRVERNPEKRWQVQLICCGLDAGTDGYDTWEEADALRRAYVDTPHGHKREAIVTEAVTPSRPERPPVCQRCGGTGYITYKPAERQFNADRAEQSCSCGGGSRS